MFDEMCACGQPLHYANPYVRHMVEEFIQEKGPCITVAALGRRWRVPRHFIALHGIKAQELPLLAERYGFAEIMPWSPMVN